MAVIATAAIMVSCFGAEEANNVLPEDGVLTLVRDIELSSPTRSSSPGTLTVAFDVNTETVLGYSISENVLEYLKMTYDEFDTYLRNELGGCYNDLSGDSAPGTRGVVLDIRTCLKGCKEDYAKGDGLGWCKVDCWVEAVITTAERIF